MLKMYYTNHCLDISNQSGRLFTFAVIFSIVGNVYAVGSLGFGEILIILAIALCVAKQGLVVRVSAFDIKHSFILFFAYAVIISLSVAMLFGRISISDAIERIIRDTFYVIVIFVFSASFFERAYAHRVIAWLSVALSVFVFVQFFAYLLFRIHFMGLIKVLPLASGESFIDLKNHYLKMASYQGYIRANGFLDEPARCAHLLSVGLLVLFFSNHERHRVLKIVIVSAGMVLTTSLNAVMLLPVCYLIFYWFSLKQSGRKPSPWMVVFPVIAIITGMVLNLCVPFVQPLLQRLTYVKTSTTGSTVLRLLRGFAFYGELPLWSKVFGIGVGNFLGFKDAFQIITPYEEATEYMNTFSYILVSTGIVGTFLLATAMRRLYKRTDILGKSIVLLLIVTSLSSSIYSTPYMIIAMSFVITGVKAGRLPNDECINRFRFQ